MQTEKKHLDIAQLSEKLRDRSISDAERAQLNNFLADKFKLYDIEPVEHNGKSRGILKGKKWDKEGVTQCIVKFDQVESGITEQESRATIKDIGYKYGGIDELLDWDENHPHVSVYKYFSDETIQDYQPKVSKFELKRIVTLIGDGLSNIHSANLVHNDIKPQNIMVRKNANLETTITDLGSVRKAGTTRENEITDGSRATIDPLLIYGDAKEYSAQSDTYAFAKTMLFMLTGKFGPEFYEEDGVRHAEYNGNSLEQEEGLNINAYNQAIEDTLSEIHTGWNGEYRNSVKKVLRNALSIDPSKRYSSAKEFSENLSEAIGKNTVVQTWQNNKKKIAIGAIALATAGFFTTDKVRTELTEGTYEQRMDLLEEGLLKKFDSLHYLESQRYTEEREEDIQSMKDIMDDLDAGVISKKEYQEKMSSYLEPLGQTENFFSRINRKSEWDKIKEELQPTIEYLSEKKISYQDAITLFEYQNHLGLNLDDVSIAGQPASKALDSLYELERLSADQGMSTNSGKFKIAEEEGKFYFDIDTEDLNSFLYQASNAYRKLD